MHGYYTSYFIATDTVYKVIERKRKVAQ